ncbi:ventricular zone-expressed PH domain-containing protein homolog 1 [Protobothrops mucrosquamatus]|uniref:ventricular zone-expressed PH domain-containing protein homolog 1 n=1 Tax=Protobothrops mucrosquamatus TaxID=103944 RepID=UPI000775B1A5|nr:ventricular zone-expressed PH domain-containing protein homolog 1 [Protobothrops mucrosquamatus]
MSTSLNSKKCHLPDLISLAESTMHHLLRLVLEQKDLSRAGELFSLDDCEIEGCLSEALEQIKLISSSPDYQTNDNDQAVVEICITRITSAIRETESIEKHGKALIDLWESCLEHNLKPFCKDEDTPHAKIASDIMSCILQNYNRPPIIALAVPVAVKFLQRGNKELCRNLSSYLSLAAISKAELLAEHTEIIVKSILQGNSTLLRVLPSLYEKQQEPLSNHLRELVGLMPHLEPSEQQHLLQLLLTVAKKKQPKVLKQCISSLIDHLRDPLYNDIILDIFIEISDYEPELLANLLPILKETGESFPNLIGQMAKIFGAVGQVDEEQARICLIYLLNQLANMEHSFHHIILLEIKYITDTFSNILGIQSRDIYRMSNSFTAVAKHLIQQLKNNTRSECRSQSLVVHAGHMKNIHADSKGEGENGDVTASISFTDLYLSQETDKLPSSAGSEESQLEQSSFSRPSIKCSEPEKLPEPVKENCHKENPKTIKNPMEYQDKLYFHLKENLCKVKAYVMEMGKKIPFPDECLIEDTVKSCVAKLSFSCPLKGHYCLYSKSGFALISHQPQLWIHIMFLFQQGLFPEPLSMQNNSLQVLKTLWEKTQLKGTHSFETAMVQSTFPHKKDLDHIQLHLEEVRFFDLFSYNEEARAWQCFMCNNPEKATVMNQDGQPLIEGRLKEKQIRWKFIKRWKTRYFTLAGNQLLFQKGKSKDDPDDCPIELSKVQSVKVVAKKRRDRSLPRAFEIFTDNKTYVFKAQDEKNAEEWLQCINVAVVQAKERESREATTYL